MDDVLKGAVVPAGPGAEPIVVDIAGRSWVVEWHRRPRRSLEFQLQPPNRILCISPGRVSRSRLDMLLRQRWTWVQRAASHFAALDIPTYSFSAGDEVWVQGSRWPLRLQTSSSETKAWFDQDEQCVQVLGSTLQSAAVKNLLEKAYRSAAKESLDVVLPRWAESTGLVPEKYSITNARHRWGSCSGRRLNFSWRLYMVPRDILDYVVVHELCHLQEPHHGAAFWNLVARSLPSYEKKRQWLKFRGPQFYWPDN